MLRASLAMVVLAFSRGPATLAGSVTDSDGRPLFNAEIVIADLQRSDQTNVRGEFFIGDIEPGRHTVTIRKIGFAALDTSIEFVADHSYNREFQLTRARALDSVVVTEKAVDPALRSFEENRRIGLGHFLDRADLAKMDGRMLSDVLVQLPGLGIVNAPGNRGYALSTRKPPSIGLTGVYCPADEGEKMAGITCACYAQVYLDNQLMNSPQPSGSPGGKRSPTGTRMETPPFDVNSLAPGQIEAIEYYAGPSQTPMKYSKLNSACGVLVIHTRRFKAPS